jgi:homoserine dehydrogenase
MKKIVLLGFGTIGGSVGRIISEDGSARRKSLAENPKSVSSISDTLANLEIAAIVTLEKDQVKELITTNDQYAGISNALVTDSYDEALELGPDIVVELIGGVEPAHKFIAEALKRRIDVVTANKAVLGVYGQELRDLAAQRGAQLLYEAAVGGAVPIVRAIRHSLMGDKIISMRGVLNGTTNFILDKMTTEGMDYDVALKQAQELGFAEADPTADVGGFDPAAKIAILGSLAFGRDLKQSDVDTTGITEITQGMIIKAKNEGQVYKLVAVATRSGEDITLKVAPELVPADSAFGKLQGSENAVEVISEYSTTLTFFGPGAGGDPTASAVLADVVEVASNSLS